MSKINHTKKVIEYLNVFRKYFRVRQEVSYETPTSILLLKTSFKLTLKIIYLVRKQMKSNLG